MFCFPRLSAAPQRDPGSTAWCLMTDCPQRFSLQTFSFAPFPGPKEPLDGLGHECFCQEPCPAHSQLFNNYDPAHLVFLACFPLKDSDSPPFLSLFIPAFLLFLLSLLAQCHQLHTLPAQLCLSPTSQVPAFQAQRWGSEMRRSFWIAGVRCVLHSTASAVAPVSPTQPHKGP